MVQLKQLAIELELQYQVLEVTNERMALERESRALESDIMVSRDHQARHAEHESGVFKVRLVLFDTKVSRLICGSELIVRGAVCIP